MTRDDILRLAREAGGTLSSFDRWSMHTSDVVRFGGLVAAVEREACAKICDEEATIEGIAQRCADSIRARSNV